MTENRLYLEVILVLAFAFFVGAIAIVWVNLNHDFINGAATIWGGVMAIIILQCYQLYRIWMKDLEELQGKTPAKGFACVCPGCSSDCEQSQEGAKP